MPPQTQVPPPFPVPAQVPAPAEEQAPVSPQALLPITASAPENVLQQLMDALEALGSQGRRADIKVSPPMFKGLPGVKPDPYLLKANNWLTNNRTPDQEKSHDFTYTLHDKATE